MSAIVVALLFFVGCHLVRDGIHRWRTPQPEGENSRSGIWINRRGRQALDQNGGEHGG